jgi:hypothetical protein
MKNMLNELDTNINMETTLISGQLTYYILQLKGQIKRLRSDILNEPDYDKKLDFIRHQYKLIQVLSDIINGKMRLVGCQHRQSYSEID